MELQFKLLFTNIIKIKRHSSLLSHIAIFYKSNVLHTTYQFIFYYISTPIFFFLKKRSVLSRITYSIYVPLYKNRVIFRIFSMLIKRLCESGDPNRSDHQNVLLNINKCNRAFLYSQHQRSVFFL